MAKYKNLDEDIEIITNREVVKKNKVSMGAIGFILLAVLCILGGMSIEDPNSSLSTFLFTAAVFMAIGGLVKFFMGRNCYFFRPTGSKINKMILYFDPRESQTLQYCMEEKKFEDLKNLKRQVNTGTKVEVMAAGDQKFAAVQVYEYIPYNYEAVTPVFCYYGDEARNFFGFLKQMR